MLSTNLGFDAGSSGGSWLFKQGDLLLGPVPFSKLLELLYSGEVDEATPVAPFNLDPKFTPLGEVERFRVHLAKAKAKLRVEAQSHAEDARRRHARMLRMAAVGATSIALLLAGGKLAWWLALHRPWEKSIQLPEPVITEDELPHIKLASARTGEDELAYPASTGTPGVKPKPTDRKPKPAAQPHAVAARSRPEGDDVGLAQQWDQGAINSVVRANKATLHPCLAAEAKRQSAGWEASVPIEFTIANDGHVSRLWIDHRDYKSEDSSLFQCMMTELKKWKFPPYEGEQANVSLGFRIHGR